LQKDISFNDDGSKNDIDKVKRKRINRVKTLIITAIFILFLIPTLLCIVLGFKLYKLQRQIDTFLTTDISMIDAKEQDNLNNYAFAAAANDSENEFIYSDEPVDENLIDSIEELSSLLSEISDDENKSNTDNKSDTYTGENEDSSSDNANGKSKVTNKDSKGFYSGKNVYLTFDDGPSENTGKILDILAEYNVKATFFVIGSTDKEALEIYKRIVNEGHTLGMHSYSHNYKKIYNSLEDFDKDFTKLWKLLYDTTGYMPTLYRFPGGSHNQVSKRDMKEFIRYLKDKGITYFDWNVVSGDAEGKDYTKEQMINNVLSGVAEKKTPVVLMHDGLGKSKTVDLLPVILEALISGGAQVLPLDENVPLVQQIKASSVK